jgi:ATP-binding cassette subfamily B protein
MDSFEYAMPSHPQPAWQGDGEDLAGLRVLFVDDERESRAVLSAMLSVLNASVVTVQSTREALNALRMQPFDVLVSDLWLGEQSGCELLRAVRSLRDPCHAIPAIAVTGHVTPEDRSMTRAAGFQMHLAKPVDMQALLLAIRNLVASPPQDSPDRTGAAA